jgi:Uma2 family endonuclease
MATTKLWTIDEVAQLPEDAFRYALIKGELFRMPPPGGRHGRVTNTIGRLVGNFVAEHRLGAVYNQSGFIFERDPDTLFGPDLSYVRIDRAPPNDVGYPELAPDLVVEVASPSETGPSIAEKTAIYLSAGVRLIWIIDPERRTVRIHRSDGSESMLTEQDAFNGEDGLPGFKLPIAQVFD